MTWKPDLVIYHSPCVDGFTAAWAAWLRWGDACEYYGTNYGAPPPDVTGKNVLIVDFSYKAAVLDEMGRSASSIIILDHHISAQDELQGYRRFAESPHRFTLPVAASMVEDLQNGGYPAVNALFDMGRSGARLAWEFCHHGKDIPWIVRLVEDRDLWKFEYDQSEPFAVYLRSVEQTFLEWSAIHEQLEAPVCHDALMQEARGINRLFLKQVRELAKRAYTTVIDGKSVPTVNCSYQWSSEVGHALLDLYPQAPFAATWSTDGKSIGYSLRSQDSRADVSAIAQRYGGGGHRNAAGFTVPRS